jgi:hypothetical protein
MPIYFNILQLYLVTEFGMLALFFYFILRSKILKYSLLILFIPILTFAIYNFIYHNNGTFNNSLAILHFLTFLIILLFFFFEKMKIVSRNPMYKSITFWLCVGLMVYFAGNFFYLLLFNYSKNQELIKQMRTINTIVTISKDLILALAWIAHESIETKEDIITIPDGLGLDDDVPLIRKINPNA